MASSAFSINSISVPQSTGIAVSTTFGATVTLTIDSITGASSIAWSIVGVNDPSTSVPTITASGTPTGATATFTAGSDPGNGKGLSYLIRCRVTDGNGQRYYSYGVVGVKNAGGFVPFAAGEDLNGRHPTMGWTVGANDMALGFPNTAWNDTTTSTDVATAATVNIPASQVVQISSIWSAYDATSGDRLFRHSTAMFQNSAGTSVQLGTTSDVINHEDDATWSASFTTTGSDVKIQYSGDATNSTTWRGFVWTFSPGN